MMLRVCNKNFTVQRYFTSSSTMKRTYEDAIKALNSLQTNSEVLDAVLKERQKNVHSNLPQTQAFLERSGMTLEDLDSIPTIHVSGTKGKGSTCALCESILRQFGLKTGFYSSPHLVSATERIRVNGFPISESDFSSHFWSVYDKVCDGFQDRPAYFKFLTILAFNIFWKEKVDVAIIEVGVGGMYDCTNIIRNPIAAGITKLDLDHTSLLGDTIEKIAWQKAGIMKKNRPTFIDPNQAQSALQVFSNRAEEVGSPLFAVPDLGSYDWGPFPVGALGLYGAMNRTNASLALQLSNFFLRERFPKFRRNFSHSDPTIGDVLIEKAPAFELKAQDALGLRLCKWPGRTQVISRGKLVYFLDGAHTELSCQGCRSWFDTQSDVMMAEKLPREKILKILIFNATRDRKAETLLAPFSTADLDHAIFCTNISRTSCKTDNANFTTTFEKEAKRIEEHSVVWTNLQKFKTENNPGNGDGSDCKDIFAHSIPCSVIPYNDDALQHVEKLGESYEQVQILITGSLHLIGGILNLIDPKLWNRQKTAKESLSEKKLSEWYHELQNESQEVKFCERS